MRKGTLFVKLHNCVYLFLLAFLILFSFVYLQMVGDTYTVKVSEPIRYYYPDENEEEVDHGTGRICEAWVPSDSVGDVEILGIKDLGEAMEITVRSLRPGRVYLSFRFSEDQENLVVLYVHPGGLITRDDYFGDCTGSYMLRVLWTLYLAFLVMHFVREYRESVRKNRYLYKNILYCGLIIFMTYILLFQVSVIFQDGGAIDVLMRLMNAMGIFVFFAFFPMVILSVLVMISNIRLIRREGRNWRNLIGTMLGFTMLFACVFRI